MNDTQDQADEAIHRAENKSMRAVLLFLVPIFVTGTLAWGTWVTTRLFAIESAMSRHATAEQLHESESRIIKRLDSDSRDVNQRISTLPSPDWRDRIITLEKGQNQINQGIARIEALLEIVREEQKRKGM